MNIAAIVIPLVGVIIGAAPTYFVRSRSEQLGQQHDLEKHELELRESWDQLELDAYVNYLGNAVECLACPARPAERAVLMTFLLKLIWQPP